MARKELWSAAKLAVRAYAHDPSQENSLKVAMAWKAIRDDSAPAPRRASPGIGSRSLRVAASRSIAGGLEQTPS